jgi:hypothetical protein
LGDGLFSLQGGDNQAPDGFVVVAHDFVCRYLLWLSRHALLAGKISTNLPRDKPEFLVSDASLKVAEA